MGSLIAVAEESQDFFRNYRILFSPDTALIQEMPSQLAFLRRVMRIERERGLSILEHDPILVLHPNYHRNSGNNPGVSIKRSLLSLDYRGNGPTEMSTVQGVTSAGISHYSSDDEVAELLVRARTAGRIGQMTDFQSVDCDGEVSGLQCNRVLNALLVLLESRPSYIQGRFAIQVVTAERQSSLGYFHSGGVILVAEDSTATQIQELLHRAYASQAH